MYAILMTCHRCTATEMTKIAALNALPDEHTCQRCGYVSFVEDMPGMVDAIEAISSFESQVVQSLTTTK